jgi:DNA polymerase
VVSVDASQIEARLNAVLSGQWDLVEQFRRGEDVYASFASEIYQMPINKQEHPTQRFVGKTGILSLGYGSSAPVFQGMCRVQGNVYLTDAEATSIVFIYRKKMREIVANWRYGDDVVLPMLETGKTSELLDAHTDSQWRAWGPVSIEKCKLRLPSGNFLRYRDLHQEQGDKGRMEWVFMRGNRPIHTYGAKLVENAIQALAFIHLKEVALRVKDMTSGLLLPCHQVHDELIYVVDERLAEMTRDLVVREMRKPPTWMPRAPLDAEGHIGPTYGDVK